ncbi:hypothetical protein LN650_19955 [Klebsiella pneumoniae subsp. pneumoniae]|nr:hypothetical protein [Klebsiella pneumoniae subsp. pneumoniae]
MLDKQTKRDILTHNKSVQANSSAFNRKGFEISEAKPQVGNIIKGYRTLTPGDIDRMNRLKDVSRHFCSLLDNRTDAYH